MDRNELDVRKGGRSSGLLVVRIEGRKRRGEKRELFSAVSSSSSLPSLCPTLPSLPSSHFLSAVEALPPNE